MATEGSPEFSSFQDYSEQKILLKVSVSITLAL